MSLAGSLALYVLAGLCEIGGGYLMWLTLRESRHWGYAVAGAAILILYGIIPTLQPANFGRVYAAYRVIPLVGLGSRRSSSGSL